MGMSLMDFTERLVPISDFSQGKAGKIFADVSKNNNEYVVLKNNQPTAVLISIKEYKEIQEKLAKMERLLEDIKKIRLLRAAEQRTDNSIISFDNLLKEDEFTMEDMIEAVDNAEFV